MASQQSSASGAVVPAPRRSRRSSTADGVAEPSSHPQLLWLSEIRSGQESLVGVKAATLAELARNGFAVPDGFVVTTLARDPSGEAPVGELAADIVVAATSFGGRPLAVRSSAVAEDQPDASYAGLYETVLDVQGSEALMEAIGRVWASTDADRVVRYRDAVADSQAGTRIAVLVQPMIAADAAGVAFTADPLTGDRSTTVVTAVRGIGERLVSGAATPDEWEIRDGRVRVRHEAEASLDPAQVLAVAEVARRLEARAGRPQDVEWAISGDTVMVLQARPMTALPTPVTWQVDEPGAWVRNFRLGEWLADPVTPLFESWAVTGIEHRMHETYASWTGIRPKGPAHVLVNGWYFYGFNFLPADRRRLVAELVLHYVPKLILRPRRAAMALPPLAKLGIGLAHREWRATIQPAYRATVAAAELEIPTAGPERLVALLDSLVDAAGTYFTSVTTVGGYAAKATLPLAKLYRKHLRPVIGGSPLDLLSGLGDGPTPGSSHHVISLDWIEPPPSAEEAAPADPEAEARWRRAREARLAAESRARSALAPDPRTLARFDALLDEAQRFDVIREEMARELTLAWPAMRDAVLRIGDLLVTRGVIAHRADVFLLSRSEVVAAVTGDGGMLSGRVATRRTARESQRRLAPPLLIGVVPPMFQQMLDEYAAVLADPVDDPDALVGLPASSGRATGHVRIIRSPAEFVTVQAGEILVASMTTPAWTPLFDRIAGVVTDNGGVGAHASIVAREFGIPAVVGLGDATERLRDGDLVLVDGTAGTVRRIG